MSDSPVGSVLVKANAAVDVFAHAVDSDISRLEANTEVLISVLTENITMGVETSTVKLIPYITFLNTRVHINIIRIHFHASPGLLLFLTSVWEAINVVWKGVQYVVSAVKLIRSLQIDDLLYRIWPWYRTVIDSYRKIMTDLSSTIGWGVDGLIHLLNATKGVSEVIAGIGGNTLSGLNMRWMDKMLNVSQNVSDNITLVENNPGALLDIVFSSEGYKDFTILSKWSGEKFGGLASALLTTEESIKGMGDIVGELQAIQDGMPEFIRQNIPQAIWDSLEQADNYIHTYILPSIWGANNAITQLNNIFDAHSAKLSDLAGKLAHPGEILLTVDDLPQYAKDAQLNMIDDVTSRQFEILSEGERRDLEGDLNEFDRIDRLATAPTPEPAFLDIEIPMGKTIRGITAEPHETWFVGNF